MSNQCSNFIDYRSFCIFTTFHTPLKSCSTTLNPIFPFHNDSLVIARRRSRRTRGPSHPRPPLAAQSSPDIVLIATTEHHDGSLLFQFGDASEVVKNDEEVVEIDSKSKCENNVVKVLDGDQEREVIIKTLEREYGSGEGRHTELADGIRNVEINSDGIQRETKVTSDLGLYHGGSRKKLSDISKEEIVRLQSDDKMNNSIKGVESTPDTRECAAQLDRDESLNPMSTSVLDNSLSGDNSLGHEGMLSKDNDDETKAQSVSVKFETMQVSHVEVMDVDKPYAEDEVLMVETDNTSESDAKDLMSPSTMHVSHVQLADAASEDVGEGLQGRNTEEGTVIDDMPASDIEEGTLIDEMPPSDPLGAGPTFDDVSQLQTALVNLGATTPVSMTETMDVKDRVMEDEVQEVITNNKGANDIADVMPGSQIIQTEPLLEEEVNQLQSAPVELELQVSSIEAQDTVNLNLDDGILQVTDEDESYIMDQAASSHPLEAQRVQDEGVNHNMLEQCAEPDALGSSILIKQDVDGSLLEAERIEDRESSSELAGVSEDRAILFAAERKVKREEIYITDYILSSGAALLEHPSKALTGGDDAYFLAGSNWLGIANGVSKWSFEGTDPGVYAQELMKACEKIVLDGRTIPMSNPAELLCRGVKETNITGSSNVLIANFDGQALHVANIGDTGFLIVRHGAIYKKSSPLLHEFHFALQVGECDDPLQLVEEHRIELDEGDIVVCATDGLFDNLYEREIAVIVSKSLQAGMKPEGIAEVLATRAQEVGRSAFARSPFSDAAQAAGYTGCAGGKPDNVAVIVSLVVKTTNRLVE